jgi:Na+/proline symporter/signal transduction histidine kinase
MTGTLAILVTLAYVAGLFGVAYYGDRKGSLQAKRPARAAIYALSLSVYCTSWTFFGSVGLASRAGLDFLPIYLGPILVVGLGYPLLSRVVRLAKSHNITSVADFLAARYGKSESVAAVVALICVVGIAPYLALQLKAVASSLLVVWRGQPHAPPPPDSLEAALTLVAAVVLAVFAMLFGTRKVDATEHQDGLMLAVAVESVVKLVAFLAVGVFVTFDLFDGFLDLTAQAQSAPHTRALVERAPDWRDWTAMTLLSGFAILLLPRQFHVAVVENRDERDVRTAAWVFPIYLIAINIFVLPLAIAGELLAPAVDAADRDMMVLTLPMRAGSDAMTIAALLGGISAATAMVIVSTVALSIMVSNDLVIPLALRGRLSREDSQRRDVGPLILMVRRLVIVGVLALAYLYARTAQQTALASIGLVSFAAIGQIAPAFFGGLIWRGATARGANAGMISGIAVWAYTMLLPSLNPELDMFGGVVRDGPMGVVALKPTALFGMDLPLVAHATFWSLAVNIVFYVAISLTQKANPMERLQASVFVGSTEAPMGQALRVWRATTTVGELIATVERYLGRERTRRSFEAFAETRGQDADPAREADIHVVRFAEYLLASAIGAASSRLVLSLLLRRGAVSNKAALKLLDDASAAIQHNRDVLQHALDHARQGITVFDRNLRLLAWNREFRDLFQLPSDMLRVGVGLEQIVRYNAERGLYGEGDADDFVAVRVESLVNDAEPIRLRLEAAPVIEIRSARLPDGGLVTTYTDVTDAVEAEEALEATNETLELRVRERTDQLMRLNDELARAKAEADEANLSKTRFLAAASHDLLQPLNAARLYTTSLVERAGDLPPQDEAALARNVDASLEAVEEILTSLLDISRLDAGALKPEFGRFDLADMLRQLHVEFAPVARAKGLRLDLRVGPCGVRSDRRLLRRLVQNFISNAVKYTPRGRVLVTCRARGDIVRVSVIDTGLGVPRAQRKAVFEEFRRLDGGAQVARGLGLGLSIVERLGRVLRHRIGLRSIEGRGSVFYVDVPRVETPAQEQGPPAPAPAPVAALAGLTIVALDNEPRILDGLKLMLEGWGCRVFVGRDAGEALAAAPEGLRVAGVLADYHLDENRTGLEAIARLRLEWGHVPAALITADRTDELRARAAEADIAVLNKPLKPAALRALLTQWRALAGG